MEGLGVNIGLVAIVSIVVLVAVASFAGRLGVATPVMLVVVGIALSFIPGVQITEIPPELVLDVLLPPILYAAAIQVPFVEFRRNIGTIGILAVALVFITAFTTGLLTFAVIPAVTVPAIGIALGAVLSPPDAVAATAVGRRLGLPPRLLTILEGEGLVNDATALVLFATAVSAIDSPSTSVGMPILKFGYAVVVAVAVGLAAGALSVLVRSRLDDPVLGTAVSIAVPFIAFVPTQVVGASGVLATVVAGLYVGYRNPAAFSAQVRISDRTNWLTIQFLLENGVFLLIGLQLRHLVAEVGEANEGPDLGQTIALGLGATVVLILLRYVVVGPLVIGLRLRARHAERSTYEAKLALDEYLRGEHRRAPRNRTVGRLTPELRYERQRADLERLRRDDIDWRAGVVLGWSGMRGVVSLAAAQSLPAKQISVQPQLVLIAFVVAFVTLVLQGSTLPVLIRLLGVRAADVQEDRQALAALLDELSETGLGVLDDPSEAIDSDHPLDPDVVDRARRSTTLRVESAYERSRGADQPLNETPHLQYRRLRRAVLKAERDRLLEIRSRGVYPARVEAEAQRLLDIEDARLGAGRLD